ncbi:hypothetical protein DSO57_1017039 [Entomophthora muscae]|uniref:Uncharacterized protein n=1 Tax=Entomophthora muscae TaxID=34485 RepID=A0ACC2SHN8_9FUNG|nr:hypothetical protein DSO57_1017039 [Entomophthora muscae]
MQLLVFSLLHLTLASREPCLKEALYDAMYSHPDHACAVVNAWSTTSGPGRDWVMEDFTCSLLDLYFTKICIPANGKTAWIKRAGDGGYENWAYDGSRFGREGKKLYVKN